MKNPVEICVEIKHKTPAAFLASDGTREEWLPKSQIKTDPDCMVGKSTTITMPEWLAKAKGFI